MSDRVSEKVEKVIVEELPLTDVRDHRKERRYLSKGGEIAEIVNQAPPENYFAHIAYWASPQGVRRGNHVNNCAEYLYIVSGLLELHTVDLATGERHTVLLRAGGKVFIPANTPHFFLARQDSQVIEYSVEPYDEKNVRRFEFTEA